jgi:hypothetical protein
VAELRCSRFFWYTDSGKVSSNGTALDVIGADEAWLVYSAETAHLNPDATLQELDDIVTDRLWAAVDFGYNSLRQESSDDFQQYYNRTTIDLGTSQDIGQQPIPDRLENWKTGGREASDVELMTLQFNYGKYLLIQSSRPGTLPANLQGIWNKDFNPPWDSKFTLNINLEMNYWLAQPLNLREIAEPVVDFLEQLSVVGHDVASRMYGADGCKTVWCHRTIRNKKTRFCFANVYLE